jgi:hypothetical protein
MTLSRSSSTSRFRVILLKQGAQRERRPERAVRHDWHRLIARAVNLPVQDGRAGAAFVALLAALPAGSHRPHAAATPGACNQLPIGTGARTRFILACNERGAFAAIAVAWPMRASGRRLAIVQCSERGKYGCSWGEA